MTFNVFFSDAQYFQHLNGPFIFCVAGFHGEVGPIPRDIQTSIGRELAGGT